MPAKFHAAHYNAIAKDIREELLRYGANYPEIDAHEKQFRLVAGEALVDLALRFAKRFKKDNEQFDPLKFLDACSPDPELYPLSELWEDDNGE